MLRLRHRYDGSRQFRVAWSQLWMRNLNVHRDGPLERAFLEFVAAVQGDRVAPLLASRAAVLFEYVSDLDDLNSNGVISQYGRRRQ